MTNNTKAITLLHGYTDPSSNDVWKEVTVRCPLFDDEIKAQEACGQSVSQSLYTLHFMSQCITSFGPLVKSPGPVVLRRMHRDDVAMIYAAMCDLEMGPSEGNESPGDDGWEETPEQG